MSKLKFIDLFAGLGDIAGINEKYKNKGTFRYSLILSINRTVGRGAGYQWRLCTFLFVTRKY